MQIDTHVHSDGSAKHVRRLLKICDKIGTDKAVIFNTGHFTEGKPLDKPDLPILKACGKHPDRLIPFARLLPDTHKPKDIREFKDMGFSGLKVIGPRKNYDDCSYLPLYQTAAELKMPILFHLGIVMREPTDFDVNSNRMRPIYLDTICRAVPELHVHGAHLGNPWYEEASMSARWNANLWFDLSGSTLKKKSPEFIDSLFWWHRGNHPYRGHEKKHPYSKILFGTDVALEWMEDVHNDYVRLCSSLGITDKWRKAIFGGNAEKMLFLK